MRKKNKSSIEIKQKHTYATKNGVYWKPKNRGNLQDFHRKPFSQSNEQGHDLFQRKNKEDMFFFKKEKKTQKVNPLI
jgi:hypothetical protein